MLRLRVSSEKTLEDRLASVLKTAGYGSHHNDATVIKGIPDRYVYGAGGLWIEVKLASTFHELKKGFERQATFMDMLWENNEKVYVFGLIISKDKRFANTLFFEDWHTFKQRTGSGERINGWPNYTDSYEQLDAAIKYGISVAADA